ncbi:CHAT domain-containing protein [Kitasatospora herbaricolor]|uniref:CHAT domain-containing tetratricopeptide repeat protein n=1 Tax=Kitasatospora herbaricolor TaxID=68217 RepID=UPI0036DB1DEE
MEQFTELTELLASQDISEETSAEIRYLLGWMHWQRSEALGAPDLEAAFEIFLSIFISNPEALSVTPAKLVPVVAERAVPAAHSLLARAASSSDSELANGAVSIWQHIVDATPEDHPGRPVMLSGLGIALRTRFERIGVFEDLEDAIQAGRAAVGASSPEDPRRPTHVANLSHAIFSRFERLGTRKDLDEAISLARAAVATIAVTEPDRVAMLSNLGIMLRSRFERYGALEDLDEAISLARAVRDATRSQDPDRPRLLASLGSSLNTRFERSGALEDLDEAISLLREARDATSSEDPSLARRLSSLGGMLRSRFERSGALEDLDEAISLLREARDADAADEPSRIWVLSNLGLALQARFARSGGAENLSEAISLLRVAVDASAVEAPGRAALLSALGSALATRFEDVGVLEDLNEAINVLRVAVDVSAVEEPGRGSILSNLGNALRTRFDNVGAPDDLDEAIGVLESAVEATSEDQPVRVAILSNLGVALLSRFQRSGEIADVKDAASHYASAMAVRSATPMLRIRAARSAALLAGPYEPHRMAGLMETAIELLPEVAGRYLTRSDQQYALGGLSGLASDAAALALSDTHLTEPARAEWALRLLEAGRAVLLSQALDTRNDVTDLRDQHPQLAQRYIELRDLLDQSYGSDGHAAVPDGVAVGRRALVGEFQAVLDQIRALPRFASFARLPSVEDLLLQAADGPVVSFSVSYHRCDALLMTTSGITSVSLSNLSIDVLEEQIESFHDALAAVGDSTVPSVDRRRAQGVLVEVLAWLWEVAVEPVLDALGYRELHSTGDWPRVWWATGGLLGLLPLHAAGHHGPGFAGQSAIDRVVSSYTPTIRALGYARQQSVAVQSPNDDRSLIVAMPTTPGQRALPYAAEEAALLAARLPAPVLLAEPDASTANEPFEPISKPPTRSAVFDELPHSAIAHFACHGAHDSADPSRSRLLLHDHATAPLTIASLTSVRLERARLAYLSACRTAFHGRELLDEAIHIAAAFQLAGFPHVIATLWEIYDPIAVSVADSFYSHLRTERDNNVPDVNRAAHALHDAVRALRDQHSNLPSLWAAYIHAGA